MSEKAGQLIRKLVEKLSFEEQTEPKSGKEKEGIAEGKRTRPAAATGKKKKAKKERKARSRKKAKKGRTGYGKKLPAKKSKAKKKQKRK